MQHSQNSCVLRTCTETEPWRCHLCFDMTARGKGAGSDRAIKSYPELWFKEVHVCVAMKERP